MSIWAIVPIKPLRRGKSRLAGVLTEEERAKLNRVFLENTLSVLREIPEIEQTLVVSRDPAALAIAREFDVRTLLEDGSQELNLALTRATAIAQAYAAHGILILPADLPMLNADDLRYFLSFDRDQPCVVISPDRRDDGTNALLISPPGTIQYAFGPGSFHRHRKLAISTEAQHEVVRIPSLALDLDLPDDLKFFIESTGVNTNNLMEQNANPETTGG